MTEADELAWAEQLRSRYGIAEPVAEEPAGRDLILGFFDTEAQINDRPPVSIFD